MIEIIALFLLAKKIGMLAERKGQKPGRWKVYLVLAWLGCEFAGIFLSLMISGNMFLTLIFGLFCAFGGYLLVKRKLENMPDKERTEDWISNIGNDY